MTNKLQAIVEQGTAEDVERALSTGEFSARDLSQALHQAARLGVLTIIRTLVMHGVPADARDERTGWTPLHTAVEHQQRSSIRELVAQGADVNGPAGDGMTPLHLAVDVVADSAAQTGEQMDLSLVSLLLEFGANPDVQDNAGNSVRSWAEDTELEALLVLFR